MAVLTISAAFSCTETETGDLFVSANTPNSETITVFVERNGAPYTSKVITQGNSVSFTNLPDGEYQVYAEGSVSGESDAEFGTLACVVTPPEDAACNLAITDVTTNINGATTVSITGNNGVTEYSLDQFDTVQESAVFQDIAPGNYIMYARDKVNPRCVATYLFKIYEQYGARYFFAFDGLHNSNIQCLISKKGYNGPSEEIEVKGASPVTIKMSDADEFACTRGTECTINIFAQEDRQFNELYTADEREYRVDIYAGPNPATLQWSGYLLPNVFQYPHLAAPYSITLSATDGIGDLKQVDFKADNARFLPDFITVYDAIKLCLYQLDLPLKVLAAVDLAGAGMDPEISPLKQAQLSYMFAYEKDKIKNSYDALNQILATFKLKINQNLGGMWFIVPQKGLIYSGHLFDADGRSAGAVEYDPTVEIKTPTTGFPLYINGTQMFNISPGYKKQVVNFEYGEPINMVPTGDFKDQNPDFSPKGWEMTTPVNAAVFSDFDGYLTMSNSHLGESFEPYYAQSPPYFLKRIAALGGNKTPVRVAFTYFAFRLASAKSESQDVNFVNLYYELKVGEYYAREDGGWQATPAKIQYGTKAVNTKVDYEKLFKQPPVDGYLTIRFYDREEGNFTGVNIIYSNVSIPSAQNSGVVSFNYLINATSEPDRNRLKYITPWYRLKSGTWSLQPDNTYSFGDHEVEFSKELVNSTAKYSGEVPASPFGDIAIEFGQTVSAKFGINEIKLSKLKVQYGDFNIVANPKESEELTGTNTANYKLVREPVTLGIGDAPAGWYANGLYLGKLPIPSWTDSEDDTEQIQVLMLRDIIGRVQTHKQVLSCEIKGNLHFNAVIWDAYNQQRKMLPTGLSWDLKRGEWSGEFVEVLGTAVINPGEVTTIEYSHEEYNDIEYN